MKISAKSAAILLFAVATASSAQQWPRPSTAPVTCAPPTCDPPRLIAPYAAPLLFQGRYLDSSYVRDWQPGFRTGRAKQTGINASRNRLYMVIGGGALFAYDLPNFVARLAANEPLAPATIYGAQDASGPRKIPEVFLRPDAMFYAEKEPSWQIDHVDGQDRLFGFDWDDRGYVYVAYNPYGVGMLRDDGGSFTSVWQQRPDAPGLVTPQRVMSVKTSAGEYFVIVSPSSGGASNVFYTGNANGPTRERRSDIAHSIEGFAKTANGRIAALESDGRLHLYTNDGILAGISTMTLTPPAGVYYSVDSDGTNFYAVSKSFDQPAILTILTYGNGTYAKSEQSLSIPYDDAPHIRYGTGGYLAVWGTESWVQANPSATAAGRNLRLYKLSGTTITPVPLLVGDALGGEYFRTAYQSSNASRYAAPFAGFEGASNPPLDARVFESGGSTYLLAAMGGIGDLYRLSGGGATPTPVPVPSPSPVPSPVPVPASGCPDLSAIRAQALALISAIDGAGVVPVPVPVPPPQPPPPAPEPVPITPPQPVPQPQSGGTTCTPTQGSPPRASDGCRCTEDPQGIPRWQKFDLAQNKMVVCQ